ncbi:MAG: uracil-DNA glycosylase [Planctomycetales bacterium]|nr:uracil-DNA glycosylase [Planctomycetales bacterium]
MNLPLTELRRGLLDQLAGLHRAGIRQLPAAVAPPLAASASPPAEAPHTAAPDGEASADRKEDMPPSRPSGDKVAALQSLSQKVARCTLCAELASTRKQTVFGVGDPNARVVFFGEAPGADEDRQGEPFVGRAGQLLDKIIAACTWRREEVYILNTLKCRPPGNRNPAADELTNCRPFWERQLEIIQPEFIVCLGTFAAQSILQSTLSIGKLRGEFHQLGQSRVLCTYHPSYLLRNPSAKKDVWEDMKMLMREMGLTPPGE